MKLFEFKKLPWEIVIALAINGLLLGIFLVCKIASPVNVPTQPIEIAVDISNFTPSIPKEMKVPDRTAETRSSTTQFISYEDATNTTELISSETMQDTVPTLAPDSAIQPKSSVEYNKQDLKRIEQGIRTFNGINQVKTSLIEGSLPAGHQTGASFHGRKSSHERTKLLKRHGGSEKTESAVEKALGYLASAQNSNGSWGSPESLKTGDSVALSSLALLAFFSHGENFQSTKYGKTIRRGCDFLIELSNTPNIEYAGKGFGHAILTYSLAEGFAITGSLSLRNALERRIKYIIAHQNHFGSFAMNYGNLYQYLFDRNSDCFCLKISE